MMRHLRLVLLWPALLCLTQCSGWLPPFETVPPDTEADSTTTRVAVCYNALTASPEQLLGIATASCGPGTTPQPAGRDLALNYCPVLIPSRATYTCATP
ncbi:MAG TPA: hypothetical protein VJO12_04725 [Stellaceae bacterium]|nr:hypothetical protein [Stellaceae bacterium]